MMKFTPNKKPDIELTLCSNCASFYYTNKNYWIERVNTSQKVLDSCMICKKKNGYDFNIWKTNKSLFRNRIIAKEVHNE